MIGPDGDFTLNEIDLDSEMNFNQFFSIQYS